MCDKCSKEPCLCGWAYRDMDVEDIKNLIIRLYGVVNLRSAPGFEAWGEYDEFVKDINVQMELFFTSPAPNRGPHLIIPKRRIH